MNNDEKYAISDMLYHLKNMHFKLSIDKSIMPILT